MPTDTSTVSCLKTCPFNALYYLYRVVLKAPADAEQRDNRKTQQKLDNMQGKEVRK